MTHLMMALSTLAATISTHTPYEEARDSSIWRSSFSNLFSSQPSVRMVYGLRQTDDFRLLNDEKRYAIVDVANQRIIDVGEQKNNPFSNVNLYPVLNTGDGPFKYLVSDGNSLWSQEMPEYKVSLYGGENGVGDWVNLESVSTIPSDAHKIPNYEYFMRLRNWHGNNPDMICTLVAIQIICGYYDSFLNDSFVPEIWDRIPTKTTSDPCLGWNSWTQSPGTGFMGGFDNLTNRTQPADSRMIDHLVDYCVNHVFSLIHTYGANVSHQSDCLDHYLEEQNINQLCNYLIVSGNLLDNLNQAALNRIRSTIDAGRPIIVNGHHHSTVAFAYDSNYVYVHDGYGEVVKAPNSYFTDWDISYSPSALDLNPNCPHSHNNNYFSSTTRDFYCSCGRKMSDGETPLSDLVAIDFDTPAIQHIGPINLPYGTMEIYSQHAHLEDGGDTIVLDGSTLDGYVKALFSEDLKAVSLRIQPSYIGNTFPDYYVEYLNSNFDWIPIDIFEFLSPSTWQPSYFVIDLPEASKGIRIVAPHDSCQPKLRIKRVVFSFC